MKSTRKIIVPYDLPVSEYAKLLERGYSPISRPIAPPPQSLLSIGFSPEPKHWKVQWVYTAMAMGFMLGWHVGWLVFIPFPYLSVLLITVIFLPFDRLMRD